MDVTCNVIEDLLPLYADGICSEDSKTIVEHHIALCPECKSKLEAMTAKIEPDKSGKIPSEPENPFKKTRTHYVRLVAVTICICALIAIPAIGAIILTINEEYDRGYSWSEMKCESQMRKFGNMLKKGRYREALDMIDFQNQEYYSDERLSALKDMFAEDLEACFNKFPIKKIQFKGRGGKCTEGNMAITVQSDLLKEYTDLEMEYSLGFLYDNEGSNRLCYGLGAVNILLNGDLVWGEQYEPLEYQVKQESEFPQMWFVPDYFAENYFERLQEADNYERLNQVIFYFHNDEKYNALGSNLDRLIAINEEKERMLRHMLEDYEYVACEYGEMVYMRENIFGYKGPNRYYCQPVTLIMRSKGGEEFSASFDMPVITEFSPPAVSCFRNIVYSDNTPGDFKKQFEGIFTDLESDKSIIYPLCVHDLKTYTEPEVRTGRYYLNGDVDSCYFEVTEDTLELCGVDMSELYDSWQSWEDYTEGVSGELDYARSEDKERWLNQWLVPQHYNVKTLHYADDGVYLRYRQTYVNGYSVDIGLKVKDERTLTGFGKDGDFILVED